MAFRKLESLQLAEYQEGFGKTTAPRDWQTIELQGVTYQYPGRDGKGFTAGPVDLTLHRGELVFLIGGNGSGKSTLARLLTGLYRPVAGQILVDGKPLETEQDWDRFRQRFSTCSPISICSTACWGRRAGDRTRNWWIPGWSTCR
ncbi:MAG: ATP-binding cassette domain-containing protein [Marinobacter sp.]